MIEDKILECFRRYKRGVKMYPDLQWSDETLSQWEEDQSFFRKKYREKSNVSFSVSSEYAYEQYFLKCYREVSK